MRAVQWGMAGSSPTWQACVDSGAGMGAVDPVPACGAHTCKAKQTNPGYCISAQAIPAHGSCAPGSHLQ